MRMDAKCNLHFPNKCNRNIEMGCMVWEVGLELVNEEEGG